MKRAGGARNAGRGYTGGARGGFSVVLQHESKRFSRTAYSAVTRTNPIAPLTAAGDPITRWHSAQLPAEHWSLWCHTIPMVVANTSTINRAETRTRQIRVGSVIASEPFKSLDFLDTSPIVKCTDALWGIIRSSIGWPRQRNRPAHAEIHGMRASPL
jgi:hypothetical protein